MHTLVEQRQIKSLNKCESRLGVGKTRCLPQQLQHTRAEAQMAVHHPRCRANLSVRCSCATISLALSKDLKFRKCRPHQPEFEPARTKFSYTLSSDTMSPSTHEKRALHKEEEDGEEGKAVVMAKCKG